MTTPSVGASIPQQPKGLPSTRGDKPVDVSLSDFAAGGSSTGFPAVGSGAVQAAKKHESRNAAKAPKGRVGGKLFGTYRPSGGGIIEYSQNKVGILPNIDDVLAEIAEHSGLNLQDEVERQQFLEAIVVDVYVNSYSEEKEFEGQIDVDGFTLERYHIRDVIGKYVGTHYRRFARAMSTYVVSVMQDNLAFSQLLDKRAVELSLNSRAEAVHAFDGADALVTSRLTAERNAAAKAIALSKRKEDKYFGVETTSAHSKTVSDVNSPFSH